ncbi:hypothetical protein JCM5296_005970 [Sporobolomyces johnsonii]
MKVVGLLSGGKDSVYNLVHCIANGHQPVSVASLGPGQGKDELDSYMYQTVGHSGLRTLAQALDLPFFSRVIQGTAINIGGEYGSRNAKGKERAADEGGDEEQEHEADETEDLYELLRAVKTAQPEVEGVACGAILSNYQRVRVEHVCSRLGLTPIAYLWERDQPELLGEMVDAEMESVLVKVAGAGLGVEHLGKSLREMQPTLHRLNQRYQLHVCGEGGEYETFTLDCPIFKSRVVLSKTTTVISNPDPYSTVAHLHLDQCELVPKPEYPQDETWEELQERIKGIVRTPGLLDERSEGMREVVGRAYGEGRVEGGDEREGGEERVRDGEDELEPTASVCDGWLSFGEVTAFSGSEKKDAASELSIEDEVRAGFANLEALLSAHATSLLALSHLTVYLSAPSMPLFPLINTVYSSFFGSSPPARACVAVEMPPNSRVRVKLEGVARVSDQEAQGRERKCLHVQSLSYWAGANIGPYSQGITVAGRLFIAGQIPLVPRSLTLPSPPDFALEVALSLQHVRRVAKAASEARWEGWCEGGVCWLADGAGEGEWRRRVRGARAGWQAFEEDDEGQVQPAPMLFVTAAQLPKGASIEWQVTWATGQRDTADEDEESDDGAAGRARGAAETWASGSVVSNSTGEPVTWQCSATKGTSKVVVAILGCTADESERHALPGMGHIHSIRAFHRPSLPASKVQSLASTLLGLPPADLPALSLIGARRIATLEGSESEGHDVAFVLVGSPA